MSGLVTWILNRQDLSDQNKKDMLFQEVYDEMRGLAKRALNADAGWLGFQPTELVNETFVRLAEGTEIRAKNRPSFLSLVFRSMKNIVLSKGRASQANKRKHIRATYHDEEHPRDDFNPELLDFFELLNNLNKHSDRQAKIVALRALQGFTFQEIGEKLNISESLARQEFQLGKTWIQFRMESNLGH